MTCNFSMSHFGVLGLVSPGHFIMNALWIAVMIPFVACSSRKDAEWNYPYYALGDYLGYLIPESPEGQYFNTRDGTYHFKYDTGYGQQESFRGETRDHHGVVRGYYGYIDPDGVLRMTEYVADHLGYRVKTTLRFLVFDD